MILSKIRRIGQVDAQQSLAQSRGIDTRGHRFTGKGERFYRNLRDNVFTQRVVGVRNEQPEEVVDAGTIATFKKQLNRYMERTGLEGYGPNTRSSL